ncbi:MAG TPA: HD domain-containing protein, partial [Candidatus Angelobacter sp.]
VADKLIHAIREAFPELEVDIDSILFGAATHDIGKSVHPQELSGPGSQHERAGFALLRSLGVTSERARFTYTHAAGANESGTKIEDLLVALADNCWKAKRVAPLEEEVVRMISENLHKESWEVFAALDGILQMLAADADTRLVWQAQFPTV